MHNVKNIVIGPTYTDITVESISDIDLSIKGSQFVPAEWSLRRTILFAWMNKIIFFNDYLLINSQYVAQLHNVFFPKVFSLSEFIVWIEA